MLLLRKPSAESILAFLDSQRSLEFSYSAVGATATRPPLGYTVDHTRARLGQGEKSFQAAKAALQRWQHFQLGWVEPCSPQTPLRTGETVAILAQLAGTWWLNACRIVYAIDETAPAVRFGFAYGTLPGHVEAGEERFLIEWDVNEGSVWYDILAFSRPNHWLARIGYPFARRMQKRFARDSVAAMQRCGD